MGKNAAFAHFGAEGRNSRWSWSARSPDGETIVLTIWEDQVDLKSRPVVYDNFGKHTEFWKSRHGNRERVENLKWARDHCQGLFRVVVAVAHDEHGRPRRIKRCFPHETLIMRVTELDERTGEFRAESVSE